MLRIGRALRQDEIAIGGNPGLRAFEAEANLARIAMRRDDEVIFQSTIAAVIDEIHGGIDLGNPGPRERRQSRDRSATTVIEQIAGDTGQPLLASDRRLRLRTENIHAQYRRTASSTAGIIRVANQRESCRFRAHEEGIARSAREVRHPCIGLTSVGLEAQGDLADCNTRMFWRWKLYLSAFARMCERKASTRKHRCHGFHLNRSLGCL